MRARLVRVPGDLPQASALTEHLGRLGDLSARRNSGLTISRARGTQVGTPVLASLRAEPASGSEGSEASSSPRLSNEGTITTSNVIRIDTNILG